LRRLGITVSVKHKPTRYSLRCRCSADVVIVPGQAGGRVTCPACGAAIDVPRLRDLAACAVPEPRAAAAPRWRPCQAWLLVASAVAATATVSALAVPRLIAPPQIVPDSAAIRAAVNAVDAVTLYQAWQAMRASGIDRGTLPEELRIQQAAGSTRRIVMLLWTVAAAAGCAAAAAAAACLTGGRVAGRPRGDRPAPAEASP
jgi:hypothetical protein